MGFQLLYCPSAVLRMYALLPYALSRLIFQSYFWHVERASRQLIGQSSSFPPQPQTTPDIPCHWTGICRPLTHLFAEQFGLCGFESRRSFGLVSDALVDTVQTAVRGARLPQHLAEEQGNSQRAQRRDGRAAGSGWWVRGRKTWGRIDRDRTGTVH